MGKFGFGPSREEIATRKLGGLYGKAGVELLKGYIYPTWLEQTLGYSLERFIEFWFDAGNRPIYYARIWRADVIRGKLVRVCWQAKHDEIRTQWFETVSTSRTRTKRRFGLPDARHMSKGDLLLVRRDVRSAMFEVELYKTGQSGLPVILCFELTQEQFDRIRPKIIPTRRRK